MRFSPLPFLLATACSGGGETDTSAADTDTTPACQTLTDGTWTGSGAAFGMAMDVTLTLDGAACSFTLTDWDMVMGSLPDGGTIAEDTVTLAGTDAYWSTCVGEATGGTVIDGVCEEDGAAFSFELN